MISDWHPFRISKNYKRNYDETFREQGTEGVVEKDEGNREEEERLLGTADTSPN